MQVGGESASVDVEKRQRTRDQRYRHREFLNSMSTLGRLQHCGRRRADATGPVPVRLGADGHAHYANLQLCASAHACPVCAAKIRHRRSLEIAVGVSRQLERGGGVYFVTFTMPHNFGDRLAPMLAAIAAAYRNVTQGASAGRDKARFGLCGSIKALETNVGPNGWHPHLHVLMFTEAPLNRRAEQQLKRRLYRRWAAGIEAAGYRRPMRQFVDLRKVWNAAGVADYTSKVYDENRVGLELARADLKAGRGGESRSAWALLGDLVEQGDVADAALWWEYEQATKGKYALRWSPGLKGRLEIDKLTDEDLAEETVGGVTVASISGQLWPHVCRTRGLRVRILRAAELDGGDAVDELIAKCELDAFGELLPFAAAGADPPGSRENRQAEVLLALARLQRGVTHLLS